MATRVVMVPGWEQKVLRAADPLIRAHAFRVKAGVMGNIAAGGHVRTGALLRSVRDTREGLAHHRVWIGTDHWHYIEYGTRPHTITPRGPWPLVFQGRRGLVVTHLVNHPGNREYAVVRRAL